MSTDTSTAAAATIAPCAAAMRDQIASYIHTQGANGATCDQIEEALGYKHQTASARMRDLALAHRIMDLGERRLTRSGCNAVVWFSAEGGQ